MSDPIQPPSYPAWSSAAPAAAAPVARPKQVDIAFWLYIAAAALSLVSLILSVAMIGAVKDQIAQQVASQGQRVNESVVNSAVGVAIAIAVIFGALYVVAFVIFAVFVRRGANWARIVLTVVTVLSLFGIAGGYGTGAARVVVGVVATVLIFLKPANEYFASVKATRQLRA